MRLIREGISWETTDRLMTGSLGDGCCGGSSACPCEPIEPNKAATITSRIIGSAGLGLPPGFPARDLLPTQRHTDRITQPNPPNSSTVQTVLSVF